MALPCVGGESSTKTCSGRWARCDEKNAASRAWLRLSSHWSRDPEAKRTRQRSPLPRRHGSGAPRERAANGFDVHAVASACHSGSAASAAGIGSNSPVRLAQGPSLGPPRRCPAAKQVVICASVVRFQWLAWPHTCSRLTLYHAPNDRSKIKPSAAAGASRQSPARRSSRSSCSKLEGKQNHTACRGQCRCEPAALTVASDDQC
mmetsp:Transcript_1377/g.2729  ORF Transcript_1377/g.2729 Transcript_1377/m.2729 type:complete len:204 (-) Transcript_1377:29-640(-)